MLLLIAILPIAEIVLRATFSVGIPASGPLVQHLTLWVAFVGAMLAAREDKLLALATASFVPEGRWRRATRAFAAAVGAAASMLLFRGSLDLVLVEREAGTTLGAGIPTWIAETVLPVAFVVVGLRLAWKVSAGWNGRAFAFAGLVAGLALGQWPGVLEGTSAWPALAVVVLATALGMPIFAALGGIAAALFMIDGVPLAAIPAETYRLSVSPSLPAIPLFTLAGFLLAEGRASERLLRVFRALFGWIPGGTAVVCVLVCAFFTAFTGGSGVTILALGGLLYPALLKEGYRENFSTGILTASGSLGLLFPPALPLILYGIIAQVPIEHLFLGGILPGVVLVALAAGWGLREGIVGATGRTPFAGREALAALWAGKYELLVPAVALVALFSGYATIVEASAVTALYCLVAQVFVNRDLSITKDLPRVLRECVVLLGGVLIILGVAMGLTSWLVDAQVPAHLLEWVQGHIHSKIAFLLLLNLFLLLVGCLMDIFSAIVVVVPLIVPLAAAFGVDPVHLGIIFIANLELGYLTPPVGLNLFLASYRFERPLLSIYRDVVPMLVILAAGVLFITYVPWLTTGLVSIFGKP